MALLIMSYQIQNVFLYSFYFDKKIDKVIVLCELLMGIHLVLCWRHFVCDSVALVRCL